MADQQTAAILYTFLLCLLSLHLFWVWKRSGTKKKVPPGPSGLPIIGNLHQLGSMPHLTLARLAETYGPLIHLKMGQVPTLVVSSAKMAEEIMKTHDLTFCSRPALLSPRHLHYECSGIVFAPYGPYWRNVRRICVQELLRAKRVELESFRIVREAEVGHMIDTITSSSKAGKLVNLSEMFLSFSSNVICGVAYGKRYWEDGSELSEMMAQTDRLFGGFFVGDFFPYLDWVKYVTGLKRRLDKCFTIRDAFLEKVIDDHLLPSRGEIKDDQKDLVDVLLQLQKDGALEFPLTRDNIKAVVMDMFGAGIDTTSAILEWGMSELVKNPRVMQKAQEEVRRIVKSNHINKIKETDLHQFQYLKAVVKEIMRLHPPGPLLVPRESMEDCEIEGYHIPAKTRVLINAWAIGRHPDSWEDPEEFKPERFMDSSIDYRGQDFQLIPFGAGRRVCPGLSFGVTVLELTLANLLLHFEWGLPDGLNPNDLDMAEAFGLVVHRKSHLLLEATPLSAF
ncbi:hypothetical protein AMTRI_Chr06g198570 [Amborella trichopoda]|uniref:Cytochrome P450 n=1 Tax=Amborella trichopoda TaxID=13333 RepID=W1P7U6_AMBTC|nr:cytochrome P450 71A1 [Amborella trichopoda]ERN03060.1 hypothetical protein AMTR_s00181p00057690 [Amborella trichopoda]|eukprot:XP_006841385.1 cytochrome P450 71A1 [Amborella trichopoda]